MLPLNLGPNGIDISYAKHAQGMIGYKCMYCTIVMISLDYYYEERH
jgi:hypothetical protein